MDVGPDEVMLQMTKKRISHVSLSCNPKEIFLASLSLSQPPSSSLKSPQAPSTTNAKFSACPKPHRAAPEPSPQSPNKFYVDGLQSCMLVSRFRQENMMPHAHTKIYVLGCYPARFIISRSQARVIVLVRHLKLVHWYQLNMLNDGNFSSEIIPNICST